MSRSPLRLALALTGFVLLTGGLGCGEDSREAKLREANEAVAEIEERLAEARATLDEREQALQQAREARDEARKAVDGLEDELDEARTSVGLQATDDVLFRAVQKRLLEDEGLSDVAIAASVADGIVTLRGKVDDAKTRDRAVQVARDVPGVRDVVSQIAVPAPGPKQQDPKN